MGMTSLNLIRLSSANEKEVVFRRTHNNIIEQDHRFIKKLTAP
jgi:transposase-like protein